VLRFQQKRAGSEIGAPLLPSKSEEYANGLKIPSRQNRRFAFLIPAVVLTLIF
jgi:hypothetical protein